VNLFDHLKPKKAHLPSPLPRERLNSLLKEKIENEYVTNHFYYFIFNNLDSENRIKTVASFGNGRSLRMTPARQNRLLETPGSGMKGKDLKSVFANVSSDSVGKDDPMSFSDLLSTPEQKPKRTAMKNRQ
jgi:hypothetical protein